MGLHSAGKKDETEAYFARDQAHNRNKKQERIDIEDGNTRREKQKKIARTGYWGEAKRAGSGRRKGEKAAGRTKDMSRSRF